MLVLAALQTFYGLWPLRRVRREVAQIAQLIVGFRTAELLQQHRHRPPERLGFLPVEAGREEVALELLLRHREVVLGPPVLAEEPLGDAVDVHVGRLRREHHRDQQLHVGAVANVTGFSPGALTFARYLSSSSSCVSHCTPERNDLLPRCSLLR